MIKYFKSRRRYIASACSIMFVTCVLSISAVHAQDQYNPDDPTDGGELGGETGVPFDGGVSMLLVAAVGYGAKKAYDTRKKDEEACNTKL